MHCNATNPIQVSVDEAPDYNIHSTTPTLSVSKYFSVDETPGHDTEAPKHAKTRKQQHQLGNNQDDTMHTYTASSSTPTWRIAQSTHDVIAEELACPDRSDDVTLSLSQCQPLVAVV